VRFSTRSAHPSGSPFRTSAGALTTQAQSGKLIFQRQKCAVCHNGTLFTDSPSRLLHDVGTIKPSSGQRLGATLLGFDTPTLKGLWDTGPYLHDGSAATLTDVLSNTLHAGGTLTTTEKNDLAAYLLQIDDGETQAKAGANFQVFQHVIHRGKLPCRNFIAMNRN